MFCPHCGERLREPNQMFCQNCGSKIEITPEEPHLINKTYQSQLIKEIPSTSITTKVSISKQTQLPPGRPGRFSKKCLVYSIISVCIAILFLMLGFRIFRWSGRLFVFGYENYGFNNFPRRFTLLIILIIFHVVGSSFAGKSRKYGKLAQESEPVNTVEKLGRSLGIVGDILNDIPIGAYILILTLNLILIFF